MIVNVCRCCCYDRLPTSFSPPQVQIYPPPPASGAVRPACLPTFSLLIRLSRDACTIYLFTYFSLRQGAVRGSDTVGSIGGVIIIVLERVRKKRFRWPTLVPTLQGIRLLLVSYRNLETAADDRIILKWTFRKCSVFWRSGLIWHQAEISGGLLRKCNVHSFPCSSKGSISDQLSYYWVLNKILPHTICH